MEPATKERLKREIENAEKLAKEARDFLEKCRRAEVDVSAAERELAEVERKLKLLRGVFIESK